MSLPEDEQSKVNFYRRFEYVKKYITKKLRLSKLEFVLLLRFHLALL